MFQLDLGGSGRYCDGLSRRNFLTIGALAGIGSLTLPELLMRQAQAEQKFYESKEGVAKGVIQIILPGGMAHQESWDPKPEAPLEYRGPFGVAKTKLRGVVRLRYWL